MCPLGPSGMTESRPGLSPLSAIDVTFNWTPSNDESCTPAPGANRALGSNRAGDVTHVMGGRSRRQQKQDLSRDEWRAIKNDGHDGGVGSLNILKRIPCISSLDSERDQECQILERPLIQDCDLARGCFDSKGTSVVTIRNKVRERLASI